MTEITDREFKVFQDMTLKLLGIKLQEHKRTLVISRLSARLRDLKLESFSDYINYLEKSDNAGAELDKFINKITTNETYFFRETQHFDFLANKAFPSIEEKIKSGKKNSLRIWSSACSSGEEPYSIAISALEYFKGMRGVDIKILASDINTDVLKKAQTGQYRREDILKKVPKSLSDKYFQTPSEGIMQVKDEVRRLVTFKRINLLDSRYPLKNRLDIIFCRNVMIYFDESTKKHIMEMFHQNLEDSGFLVIGHSENLFAYTNLFAPMKNTVYSKVLGSRGEQK
ncbi:MAG: hypothetical protein A2504_02560 [Bdellovibrionales bacterium RIFOXYD12_FULL_39_22]|nr:MAG: hypothetical protein A2385_12590 [Bdellovibrionales bacterium RIFOXYB1_FULL_39_21]OFZ41187.1 MAG: hypothetical protein A2485_01000 [Bdellovibrionales bacterium RIFOXYC12_FULL_39_17]OFZ44941.1 MAG: hypothetical protein A2404_11745 [Bdellovibrionales bacterium RIFOXYC1_FULL_39_130]OFZ72072.1 MAG: hypothetical protein A2451_03390 [Bdellovibrionales bacterium RIFOXYC2_FULL_39_8]OFZ74388.1 MAG: hypothetical protein A2560_12115 [Bdellovibrionales bacterium RIFOXYD1_FULL_39_84]OFZ92390.1 MAG: